MSGKERKSGVQAKLAFNGTLKPVEQSNPRRTQARKETGKLSLSYLIYASILYVLLVNIMSITSQAFLVCCRESHMEW
jgi:hypothetical protein